MTEFHQDVNVVEILGKSNEELKRLSKERLLSFSSEEFKKIQEYFQEKGRNPSDAELETLAQTWSEHCKHKVFNGVNDYTENDEHKIVDNLFKNYIKKATEEIAQKKKFLVSVFSDNAGIIKFNDKYDVAFKVETHNHPSALDPYGGAATGIGGVIRDILGVGLGAKPFANTDIFCFGYFDTPQEKLPKSILHPKRIAKGVRAGVRDYGNRMGIPTVNGAIIFDERYLGNPLVYCGTLGVMPKGFHEKQAKPGDLIVVLGARTGRDGIHGVTFASVELEETTPSSPVQIGNPIEEKKFTDVLLQARDLKLYNCVTDCGGGGFSSAIGEMAREIGCEVHLDKAPLKYKGLKPWEIWVSESQERMILAVPPEKKEKLFELCAKEDVEATVLGKFTADKMLRLFYQGKKVAELEMDFLHGGVPRITRKAVWDTPQHEEKEFSEPEKLDEELKALLGMPNIASKETTIRQYDHEVQGGSMIKPLVGAENDGPSDAAVVKPLLEAKEAVIISNGINPKYGDIDPYWMTASAIDEAIRNIIAVGGSLEEIALLDNFCWGNPNDPKKLGELVRAVFGCYDFATAFETPFISGKDSFYNEFILEGETISVPPTLLISAVGVMPDAMKRVSMDVKEEGNLIYLVGETFNELGGSHYYALKGLIGNKAPKVNAAKAKKIYQALSQATEMGEKNMDRVVRACHDCSEGGLAVALAEMAFAGMKGLEIDLEKVPLGEEIKRADFILFSESNSRLIVEVPERFKAKFEELMTGKAFALIGKVVPEKKLIVNWKGKKVIESDLKELKQAWKKTLNW